jgi:hypothetical protein
MRVYDFPSVTVRIYAAWHTVETEFADGAILIASPEDNDNYRNTAQRLGYRDDTWTMCRDHELTHTIIAIRSGLPWCPVLHQVAHPEQDKTLTPEQIGAVEDIVLANQFAYGRMISTVRRPPFLS